VELCDWRTLKEALSKALAVLEIGTRTSLEKMERLEFYSQAIYQFSLCKDAWRNKVPHTRINYHPEHFQDLTRKLVSVPKEKIQEETSSN
jgi:hypothetical protein